MEKIYKIMTGIVIIAVLAFMVSNEMKITGYSVVGANVTVNGSCVLNLNETTILFGEVNPGATSDEVTVTVNNTGNTPQNVSIYCNPPYHGNWTTTSDLKMNCSITHWNATDAAQDYNAAMTPLRNDSTRMYTQHTHGDINISYFKVAVPVYQMNGIYEQNITIIQSC